MNAPKKACKTIVERINKTNKGKKDFQVGFLALRKDGSYGAFAMLADFNFALHDQSGNRMIDSPYL